MNLRALRKAAQIVLGVPIIFVAFILLAAFSPAIFFTVFFAAIAGYFMYFAYHHYRRMDEIEQYNKKRKEK